MPWSPGRLITGRGAIVGLHSRAPGLHLSAMSLHPLAAEFIAPCLPTKTDKLPSSSQSLHEIKRDRFRIIAGKNGAQGHAGSAARLALPSDALAGAQRNSMATFWPGGRDRKPQPSRLAVGG